MTPTTAVNNEKNQLSKKKQQDRKFYIKKYKKLLTYCWMKPTCCSVDVINEIDFTVSSESPLPAWWKRNFVNIDRS